MDKVEKISLELAQKRLALLGDVAEEARRVCNRAKFHPPLDKLRRALNKLDK